MVAYLLDTNAALRLLVDPRGLKTAPLERSDAIIYCSAATSWEIAIKTRKGRLDGQALIADWAATLETIGAEALTITAQDGILAGSLEWEHRDPFDRMIVAQARSRGLTVATSDRAILDSGLVGTLSLR